MLDWNQYRRELESTISGGLTLETGGESGLLADAGSKPMRLDPKNAGIHRTVCSAPKYPEPVHDLDRCRGRRSRGCNRDLRSDAASTRHPQDFPDHRALPLLAGSRRSRAPSVHRHRQQRGAPVQPRPAAMDLRVGQTREQLLRVRLRQRDGAAAELPDHQARHLSAARPIIPAIRSSIRSSGFRARR